MIFFANKANKTHNRKEMKLWIARDEGGELWLYGENPVKTSEGWWCLVYKIFYDSFPLPTDLFPEVKWEDDEPTEVELKIVNK